MRINIYYNVHIHFKIYHTRLGMIFFTLQKLHNILICPITAIGHNYYH